MIFCYDILPQAPQVAIKEKKHINNKNDINRIFLNLAKKEIIKFKSKILIKKNLIELKFLLNYFEKL
ncbi:hypothetical protein BpHYR1_046856 [Brachionus plicatilis]|uniref:Uncharacterized protein n=1 Tax=Brachionus plicatilis TaxID=10195 RepID=A0A3M7RFX6_BRAPC|nr:hypothetical protein BpHYR1_046856 [Brachionus plicatilis]